MGHRAFDICCAGLKGQRFLQGLIAKGYLPRNVWTYEQGGDRSDAHRSIQLICSERDIQCALERRPLLDDGVITFLVGWQFLVVPTVRTVVFHDSCLPRSRGFAPTVTALLRGDPEIGVTAFRPDDGLDSGAILARRRTGIAYPLKIRQALDIQADLMAALAIDLMEQGAEAWSSEEQEDARATYSIWRDAFDYFIDWRNDARRICRQVDALGHPYEGAKAVIDGALIVLNDVTMVEDRVFEERQPGKIWALEDGRPVVVCGEGCVRIEQASDPRGGEVVFRSLRQRFLTADNAWIMPFVARRE